MGLYLVESFQKANIFAKLAFMFLLIAEILGWIAFTTTDWGRMFTLGGDYVGYGLWRICTNLNCETNDGWLLGETLHTTSVELHHACSYYISPQLTHSFTQFFPHSLKKVF